MKNAAFALKIQYFRALRHFLFLEKSQKQSNKLKLLDTNSHKWGIWIFSISCCSSARLRWPYTPFVISALKECPSILFRSASATWKDSQSLENVCRVLCGV